MNYLYYAGKSSADFSLYITDAGVYTVPERDYESVSIPGRSGNLIIESEKFNNVDLTYPCILVDDFDVNYKALEAFLLSQRGYKKLSDSFHADEFYMASFKGFEGLKHTVYAKAGTFKIKFDRKPQRYLVSGDRVKTFTANGALKNPTRFDALPLIRAYGTGYFTIAGIRVDITSASTYTDIDCELQEAYKGLTNCNGNITLVNGEFPKLISGTNEIVISGITQLDITPRYWTI